VPRTVVEVEFGEWTPDGQIRHASYVGVRSDRLSKTIVRETAKQLSGPVRTAGKAAVGGIKVTHAERIIDPSSGLTKLDLVRYYESVAHWILPHLQGRPCSLVRGPSGVIGQLFFQKHGDKEKLGIPGIRELDPALWAGHDALLEVGSPHALAGAAQMNVIEFHTWNSLAKNIDKPDRMILDLDPGEGTVWQHVQEAATLVRTLLCELGLESWLKTSGGKGLHVVVPIAPRLDHDAVKAFSQAVVQHLARTIPSRFVAKSGPSNRVGKLFVDFLRNSHGATTVAAFSARARPGLGVSMPVSWDELPKLKSSAQWTIATAREYLSLQAADPWADYWKNRQTLTAAMKLLGFKPPLQMVTTNPVAGVTFSLCSARRPGFQCGPHPGDGATDDAAGTCR
jgi:bifunctional non-homologous end joining protein LigD